MMFGAEATALTILADAWTFLDATMGATVLIGAGAVIGLALYVLRRGKSAAK